MLGNESIAEIQRIEERNNKLWSIIHLIKEEPKSITSISKELKINRSTMRYYLSILKERRWIHVERQDNVQGRPTLVKLNRDFWDKHHAAREKTAKERIKLMESSPITKEVVSMLKKSPMDAGEALEEAFKRIKEAYPNISSEISYSEIVSVIDWLHTQKYLRMIYELSPEGKKLYGSFRK